MVKPGRSSGGGGDAFAAGCPGAALDETRIAGAEIEPAITVNPAAPRNIVATWQQDVGQGAARSDVIGAWDRSSSAGSGTIDIAKSSDGGLSWSAPTALPGVSAFAFAPAIAVDARGTVGVIWHDNRNDRLGDASRTTDVWFAHSADRGGSWSQRHVAGPFDLRTAPRPSGDLRIGEYQGLTGLRRRGFAAVFTQAAPRPRTDRRTSSSRESRLAADGGREGSARLARSFAEKAACRSLMRRHCKTYHQCVTVVA